MSDYRQECAFCGELYYGSHYCHNQKRLDWEAKVVEKRTKDEELWKEMRENFRARAARYPDLFEIDGWLERLERSVVSYRHQEVQRKLKVIDVLDELEQKANSAYEMGWNDAEAYFKSLP